MGTSLGQASSQGFGHSEQTPPVTRAALASMAFFSVGVSGLKVAAAARAALDAIRKRELDGPKGTSGN